LKGYKNPLWHQEIVKKWATDTAIRLGGITMRRKRMSFTTKYVLVFGLLMLAANTLLGIVILARLDDG